MKQRLLLMTFGEESDMTLLRHKWPSFLVAAAVALCLITASAGSASAAGRTTCQSGSITSGTYSSLAIAGVCRVDAGSVTVEHKVTVLPGAALLAAFAGSNLNVGDNVDVQKNGVLVLGCGPEPFGFVCLNGAGATADTVGQNLTAENALAVLLHHNTIGHSVIVSGGGGGLNCNPQSVLSGLPAYAAFESDTIGGNMSITGWRSCWSGVFRETVSGNVSFNNNVTADPDGNEITTNTIGGNLDCSHNSPNPQVGDSGFTALNVVSGRATGQCAGLKAP